MKQRENQDPNNPHPPGSYLAAHWDVNWALRGFGRAVLARLKRVVS